MANIKETLLNLSEKEKKERENAAKDFLFYLGECEDKTKTILNKDLLGQSWLTLDNLDYEPSQVIDNKVKPLIHKQARFMFGKEPSILFKPFEKNTKKTCEELRQYIDGILNANKFWSNTLKAFRLATVTKRVLLRLEANPNQPVKLFYHSIDDFSYRLNTDDITKIDTVTFVRQDTSTASEEEAEQTWYRYTYYMKTLENKESKCYLKLETFKGDDLQNPVETQENDTELSKIPCWVLCNEQSITNAIGTSDIKDLKPLQDTYNRRLSDFNDCLRFLMFGQTSIIDATKETVDNCKIAPNALMALKSFEDSNNNRQAKVQRVESSFSNAEPVEMFLKRLEDSMYEKLGIPRPEQLQSVPSAKSIKYMYTELIARCEEKWHDWEPIIRSMLRLIVEACGKFDCYKDWDHKWDSLLYSIVLNKNYPIPEDMEDKKHLALEEVQSNVRSHVSYIKDFSDDEDPEGQFNEIIKEITLLDNAMNSFTRGLDDDLKAMGEEE